MATGLDIVTSAMRKIGAITKNEVPSSDEVNDGIDALNDLLSSWSNESNTVYARQVESFPLNSGVPSYTIGTGGDFNTVRPIKIVSAYVRLGGTDTPVEIITDEAYGDVPFKNTGGGGSYFLNYTYGFPLGTINLYPVPGAGYTLFLISEKELNNVTLNADVSFPPGWKRALIYNLAMELAPEYSQQVSPEILNTARQSKAAIERAIMKTRSMDGTPSLGNRYNIYSGYEN
jgi:hypothetical protein